MLQKIRFQLNALYSSKNPENINIRTVFNTDNNQQIIILEWSCDTEDWSNDAENTGINYSILYIHMENSSFIL